MPRVFSEAQNPQAVLKHAGVAIRKVGRRYRHVGILYKQDGQWRLLHLAGHKELSDDPIPSPSGKYVWINPEPAIDEIRLESFSAYCRLVSQRNHDGGLPYAFSKPIHWFDATGSLALQMPDGTGLTCSSFVLAVFSAARLPLINEGTWVLREDDREWQELAITFVEQSGKATLGHLQMMRESLPAVRYRPEEVAAAAASDPIPTDFTPCLAIAAEILRLLDEAINN